MGCLSVKKYVELGRESKKPEERIRSEMKRDHDRKLGLHAVRTQESAPSEQNPLTKKCETDKVKKHKDWNKARNKWRNKQRKKKKCCCPVSLCMINQLWMLNLLK